MLDFFLFLLYDTNRELKYLIQFCEFLWEYMIIMGKVTIKDVAKEAGVAISTVSNALNDSDLVHDETKKRILEIADRMNYVPNLTGRQLKSRKSHMLGFLTSSISGDYFTVLMEAMSSQCTDLGYTLNILVSRDSKVIKNQILGNRFDGIFIFQGERIELAELNLLEKQNIKTVLLDRAYNSTNIGSVVFDSYYAGYITTKHLINLGHRKIGFIEGASDVYDSQERKRGFMDAMKEAQLPVIEDYILMGYFDELLTYNIVSVFTRNRTCEMPDAFIAGNDASAIGCIKALIDMGYRVPEDVSVTGFDDINIAQYFTPKLSTFKNPIDLQGITAARMLVNMIESNQEGKTEQLQGKLIIRDSTSIVLDRKFHI